MGSLGHKQAFIYQCVIGHNHFNQMQYATPKTKQIGYRQEHLLRKKMRIQVEFQFK